MNKIVEIGPFRLKRELQQKTTGCQHNHLSLDDNRQIVNCDDCHQQISSYFALNKLLEYWDNLRNEFSRKELEIKQAEKNQVELRAAQKVEKAWRSKTMVPACPHCGEAIFANDGFGSSVINKKIAEKRRNNPKFRRNDGSHRESI